jgi:hypothetical protein
MTFPEDKVERITVQHGRFRVSRGYDPSVRIPDEILKCVGFIGEVTHKEGTEEYGDLHATGFVVSVNSKVFGYFYHYFVTAKHVAEELQGRDTYFLVNKIGGGVMHIEAVTNTWSLHPTDKTADVAVVPIIVDTNADMRSIRVTDFIAKEDFHRFGFGLGDEVFTVGLFTEAPGSSRNLPIVRHGNLAMIPDEQIQTKLGYADAYLVEARSIGGLSGSPVWIRASMLTVVKVGENKISPDGNAPGLMVGPGKLLGLMHGHWDIRESELNKATIIHDRQKGVNLGIAIVVPASKILETINQPKLEEFRKEGDEMAAKRSVPGVDSVKTKKQEAESRPFTKGDFEAALKKASRKIVPKS